MSCLRPRGYPKPKVWWEDSKGKVVSDSGRIHVDDTRLVIESARLEDAGNYSCLAENLAGTKKAVIQLYVSSE